MPGRPWWAWVLLVPGGLALAVGVVALVWLVPSMFYGYVPEAKDRAAAEATTRTGMLAGLAGLAALGTFWLNSQVYRVTARTFEVTEQGHITDRYTKAIGQLGDDKLDVRLGGIYALERLAVDSERDHPTVVEVLSAFVRERSKPTAEDSTITDRYNKAVEQLGDDKLDIRLGGIYALERLAVDSGRVRQSVVEVLGAFTRERRNYALPLKLPTAPSPSFAPRGRRAGGSYGLGRLPPARRSAPGADVQAALTVLGRLPVKEDVSRADLSGAHLAGANLTGATLAGASLDEADLTGADLSEANLAGAYLRGANLTRAHLYQANLAGARLFEANLAGAYLGEAILTGADVSGANLTTAVWKVTSPW